MAFDALYELKSICAGAIAYPVPALTAETAIHWPPATLKENPAVEVATYSLLRKIAHVVDSLPRLETPTLPDKFDQLVESDQRLAVKTAKDSLYLLGKCANDNSMTMLDALAMLEKVYRGAATGPDKRPSHPR